MPKEPANQAGIRKWVTEHRPNILPHFEQVIRNDGLFLLMSIGFEAGRQFQKEHPKLPINSPLHYLDVE